MNDPAASTVTLVLVKGDREGCDHRPATRDGEVEIVLQPGRSDMPVTLNVQAYFAHLDLWLASSDPLFCEFSPAA
jgi:hypothetical protein